jgi:uncharacterized protein (UPF0335 family)
MLVGLAIHGWQARKYDRKISAEVAQQHAATSDAGRFNKHLLPGNAESYEAVHKKARELRSFYYENTLPWSKDGQRILPVANYEDFSEGVRKFKREYTILAENFLREYPILKEDARILLNGMFNEMDYPTVEDMRSKFAIELETLPLPSAEDFRVALADGEVARIQREIETRLQQEFLKSNQDLWNRLRLAVDNMALRLGHPGRIHDSLVGNLQAIVEMIPKLNVTGDENLEKISATCADALTGHDSQALREDTGLRAKVAAQAREISSIMDAYMAF